MTTPGPTVRRRGTDSSGRGIFASDYLWATLEKIKSDPRVAPFAHKIIVVQGAWMIKNGGGATESAGYHDRGGCLDFRSWNLTAAEMETFIRVGRMNGFALWRRDRRHGMDPHIHGVLGSDYDLSAGAARQWQQYLNGESGLSGGSSDYEWRPNPIVRRPTFTTIAAPKEDSVSMQEQLTRVEKNVQRLVDIMVKFRRDEEIRDGAARDRQLDEIERDAATSAALVQEANRSSARYRLLVSKLGELADRQSGELRQAVLDILEAEEDVKGADAPATEG